MELVSAPLDIQAKEGFAGGTIRLGDTGGRRAMPAFDCARPLSHSTSISFCRSPPEGWHWRDESFARSSRSCLSTEAGTAAPRNSLWNRSIIAKFTHSWDF